MITKLYCPDCEESFETDDGFPVCPFCGGTDCSEEWENGHFEGDMGPRKHINEVE